MSYIKKKCYLSNNVVISCNPILTNLAILSKSKCFIGNDSGPLNLSASMGITGKFNNMSRAEAKSIIEKN